MDHFSKPLSRRAFFGRVAIAVAALTITALVFARLEPDSQASSVVTLAGTAGALLVFAVVSSVAVAMVERRRGKAPNRGAWWFVMRWGMLFKLAWMGALSLLTPIAALAWALGAETSHWLWQADLLLLLGGAVLGLAASSVAHVLFLMEPRPH